MARLRSRSRRGYTIIGVLVTAVALMLTALVGQGTATAAGPGKSVSPKNANVLGKCTFTVMSVNASDATVHARIAGQAQPASLFGYATNTYTQVFCSVYDNFGNFLMSFNPNHNGPVLQTTSVTPILAFASSYFVCGQAFVKLTNGNSSLTPAVCA